jgi:hypothetical protein
MKPDGIIFADATPGGAIQNSAEMGMVGEKRNNERMTFST